MQSVKKENLIFTVWLIVQALPFLLSGYRDLTFERYYYPFYWETLILLLSCVPLLAIVELSLLLFLIEGAKDCIQAARSRPGMIAARVTLVVVTGFVAVYVLLISASWYYYSQAGVFLGHDTLQLFPLLLDYRFVLNTFSTAKLLQIIALMIGSILFSVGICYFAPPRRLGNFLSYHGRGVALCMLLVSVIVFSQNNLHPIFRGIYRANAFFSLSPQASLIWAYVRYGSFEPKLPQGSLKLVKRNPIDEAKPKPPGGKNVFLFVVEALRADALDPQVTPTLYRLHREGISFKNSYSQSSETSESMLSIITGRFPLRSGVRDRTITERTNFRVYDGIAQAGYLTGYFGEEWSTDSAITDSPFLSYRFNPLVADVSDVDPQDNPFRYQGRGLGDYSLAVADRLKMARLRQFVDKGAAAGKNLFTIFYFMSSHFPYDQTDGIPQLRHPTGLSGDYSFLNYPKTLAPTMHNRYSNTIAYVDRQIESFVQFLKQQKQLANSIIIVTGDHGENFGEHSRVAHGRHLDQEAIRVPLIIWGARGFAPRWHPLAPTGHVDIAPTIYYLLGLAPIASFQGERILSHNGAPEPGRNPDRPFFVSIQALMHEDALIQWPWKLVRNLWGEGVRLFRLDQDPQESNNLIYSHAETAQELCSCLVGFRANQLSYYNPLAALTEKYYPPHYNDCASLKINTTLIPQFCQFR